MSIFNDGEFTRQGMLLLLAILVTITALLSYLLTRIDFLDIGATQYKYVYVAMSFGVGLAVVGIVSEIVQEVAAMTTSALISIGLSLLGAVLALFAGYCAIRIGGRSG